MIYRSNETSFRIAELAYSEASPEQGKCQEGEGEARERGEKRPFLFKNSRF
jgi:hypothetical protein